MKSALDAVVVLSGGQDSTLCLFQALKNFRKVIALTFDYGQRHRVELDSAKKIADIAGVRHVILPINTLTALGHSALTDETIEVEVDGRRGLPTSFVPGRNLIFLTFAAAFAYNNNCQIIVTGVSQEDYSGYPDCREETISALQNAINLGLGFKEGDADEIIIATPMMHVTKAEALIMIAKEQASLVLEALSYSHTCYEGQVPPCGKCPACLIRAKSFADAGFPDPLITRLAFLTQV